MSLLWQAVFSVLVLEAGVTALVCILPHTLASGFLAALLRLPQSVRRWFWFVVLLIAFLLLDAYRTANKYQNLYDELKGGKIPAAVGSNGVQHTLSQLFRAQRNLYMTSMVLLLTLVIMKLISLFARERDLISKAGSAERKHQALEKQAKGAQKELERMLSQNSQPSDKEDSEEDAVIVNSLTVAKAENQELKAEVASLKAQLEALHKQAIHQQRHYKQMSEELEAAHQATSSESKKDK